MHTRRFDMTLGARGADKAPVRPTFRLIVIAAFVAMPGWSCAPASPDPEVVLSIGYAAPAEQGVATRLNVLINQLTREPLIRSGLDGHPEPVLAESWEVDRDGTRVVIVLRPGVSFYDGSPMTARDVKVTIDTARRRLALEGSNSVLSDIDSIEVTDADRVTIELSRPVARLLLLELLHLVEVRDSDGALQATGPFFVESSTSDETILRVNPHYRQGRSEIDSVHIKAYATLRSAWAAMMRSEIDFLFNVPLEAQEFMEADSNVQIFTSNRPFAYAVVFNTTRPPFADRRVRRALSHAVDRNALVKGPFRGHGSVATGVWMPHWAYGGAQPAYGYDPLTADRMLTEAGLTSTLAGSGSDEFATRFGFDMLVGVDFARFEPIALTLQRQLRQIGVEMTIDAMPFGDVVKALEGDSWHAVLLPVNTARNEHAAPVSVLALRGRPQLRRLRLRRSGRCA
jgi:peptide/nickel transport system substrate-binding protein